MVGLCEINEEFKPKTKTKALTEKEAQIIIADYYQSVRDEVTSLAGFSLRKLREGMIAGLIMETRLKMCLKELYSRFCETIQIE